MEKILKEEETVDLGLKNRMVLILKRQWDSLLRAGEIRSIPSFILLRR
jgi:hypothetical protein